VALRQQPLEFLQLQAFKVAQVVETPRGLGEAVPQVSAVLPSAKLTPVPALATVEQLSGA